MLLLIRWLVSVLIGIGGIATLSIGAARASAVSPLQPMMSVPAGLPCEQICFFGVVPEQNRLQDSLGLLRQHALTQGLRARIRRTNGFASLARQVTLGYSEDSQRITEIRVSRLADDVTAHPLNNYMRGLTLRHALIAFGTPDHVRFHAYHKVCLYFDGVRIEACSTGLADGPGTARILPHSGLMYLTLYAPSIYRRQIDGANVQAWRGFAGHYAEEPPQP